MPPSSYACPTVLSLHDLYPFDIPRNFGRLKSALARHTVAQCVRQVDAVACVSSATRLEFANRFPAMSHKAVVIPNIVEFRAPSSFTANLEPLKGRSFILCVAQHRPNKNIPLAVKVFRRLLGERILPPGARLVVVGIPGPDTPKIEAGIRSSGLNRKVLQFSGLSDAEMRWCYENCEILLAPSSMEGFGLPIAEGLLAGARVVCSDIPAFREVGGDACRYVQAADDPVHAYVDAIRDMLAGERPRKPSPLDLTAASVGNRYVRLYGEIASFPATEPDRQYDPRQNPYRAALRSK